MRKSLNEIVDELKNTDKKVQLIYAFNGTGKTRLSREFVEGLFPKEEREEEQKGLTRNHILYYNAFTEDLFFWDNDLDNNFQRKLRIQPNSFIDWIISEQGKEQNIISIFQHYTDDKLVPSFELEEYRLKDENNKEQVKYHVKSVEFSYQRGNEDVSESIKISKGEESNFIWSVFYSLLEQVIEELNNPEISERSTNEFDKLKYIFIDDPVSSLDENHLIELASNLGEEIFSSKSDLKFIVTTHNPIFFNVLANEIKKNQKKESVEITGISKKTGVPETITANKKVKKADYAKYRLEKYEDGSYDLLQQNDDSPFAYHQFLRNKIRNAINDEQVYKYHFNLLRNLYEKTSTFLGYESWRDLLPDEKDSQGNRVSYEKRILDISSHSKNSANEGALLPRSQRQLLRTLLDHIENENNFRR